MSEREALIVMRDSAYNRGSWWLGHSFQLDIDTLDAKEAVLKAEREAQAVKEANLRMEYAYRPSWDWLCRPFIPCNSGVMMKFRRYEKLVTEEVKPMKEVIVHFKQGDGAMVSTLPGFHYTQPCDRKVDLEYGCVYTQNGSVAVRFIMDIEEVVGFVTKRHVSYKIKAS